MAVTGCPFTDEQLLQAMLYVCGELDEAAVAQFEARLQDDLVLCEAVAEATRLTCLLNSHGSSVSAAAKPVLHISAATATTRRQTGTGSKWLAPTAAVALLILAVVVISRIGDSDTMTAVTERSEIPVNSDAIEFAEQLADLWSDPDGDASLSSRHWPVEPQFPEESNSALASSTAASETDWILFVLLPDDDPAPDGELRSEDDDEIVDDGDEATL